MSREAIYAGAQPGPFERAVHDLVRDPHFHLIHLSESLLLGQQDGAGPALGLARGAELEAVHGGLDVRTRASLQLIVIGGDDAVRHALEEAVATPGAGLHVAWLREDGVLWEPEGSGTTPSAFGLRELVERPGPPLDWDAFWARVAPQEQARAQEAAQMEAFTHRVRQNTPVATMALLGAIGVSFLAQNAVHALDLPLAMARMGALSKAALHGWGWTAVLSYAFLHGSVTHILFNGMALYNLGRSMEMIFGSARFLVIYGLSALAGGLLAVPFLDQGSMVGASGAIFGLLGAELGLVFGPPGLLPDPLRRQLRSGLMRNLILNALISFLPGISLTAHLGGLLGGMALVLLTPLCRGMDIHQKRTAVPGWVGITAMLTGLGLGGAWLAGLIGAFGLNLSAAPTLRPGPVGESGWVVPLPELSADADAPPGQVVLGDLRRDPAAVAITASPLPGEVSAAAAAAEISASVAPTQDAGWTLDGPVAHSTVGEAHHLAAHGRTGGGLLVDRAVRVTPQGVLLVEVVRWPQARGWSGVAERIADGARHP